MYFNSFDRKTSSVDLHRKWISAAKFSNGFAKGRFVIEEGNKTSTTLIPSFPTPKVVWYQTDVSVTLRIMLVDVDEYFLLVDEDHLRFSTTINGRHYYLCLYMFGAVIPEKCSHRNTGTEIKVNLPKAHKWIQWMRLCLEKESNPHISADLEKLQDDTITPKYYVKKDWDDINEYKRRNNIVNILPAEHSTDDSESEDEMMDALIDAADAL